MNPVPVLVLLGGAAVDEEVALCVLIQSADDIEHSSLTASGGSENGHQFGLSEFQVDAFKCMDRIFAGKVVVFLYLLIQA